MKVFFTGNGVDYAAGPYFATFSRGSHRVPIVVNIVNDRRSELDETFSLTINTTSLPFGVIRDDPYSVIVTIVDDECKQLIYAVWYLFMKTCDTIFNAIRGRSKRGSNQTVRSLKQEVVFKHL